MKASVGKKGNYFLSFHIFVLENEALSIFWVIVSKMGGVWRREQMFDVLHIQKLGFLLLTKARINLVKEKEDTVINENTGIFDNL